MDKINIDIYSDKVIPQTIISSNEDSLISQWERWKNSMESGGGEYRDVAFERIKECIKNSNFFLDLAGLELTELPNAFPLFLKEIDISYNKLKYLPDVLPNDLQELYVICNLLTCLPNNLPEKLQKLYVMCNKLTHLPNNLPASLQELYVSDNKLTYLPDILPASLKELYVSDNKLTHLPNNLSAGLEELNVSNNKLTYLPDILPASLKKLDASNNPILSIALWDKNANINTWKIIAAEEHFQVFTLFLERLHQGNNAKSTELRKVVVDWLNFLAKEENSAIRKQTFLIAQEVTENCVDRASFYFNEMHSLIIEDKIIKNNNKIEDAIDAIRCIFRRKLLEKIAAAHCENRRNISPSFSEDIEIYLAYQYRLRDELSLPVYTQLEFGYIAELTEEDLHKAKLNVLEEEKQHFIRYLVTESACWKKILKNWNEVEYDNIQSEFHKRIASDDFNNQIDVKLKSEKFPIENDTRIQLIKKITDDMVYKDFLYLTKKFLLDTNSLYFLNELHSNF
ncbi:NEL-type E3 ubiquitin ligase domain-containing protein [Candidatus Arsenophonus triatominarum]|uniref:NEL-type E3 ubiquitin ligase domain-containing protein n=1 Tax=Candidatus Arsenophonus triatominarum TaxID=57911 RepID=UPI0007C5C8E3|nr:NEL-type E3 ubiquitin ligase domain-containing protein [Candidatus Arsenophonus triatominarum]